MNGTAHTTPPGTARRSTEGPKLALNEEILRSASGTLPPTPARCQLAEQLVALSGRALLSRPPGQQGEEVALPLGAVVTPQLLRSKDDDAQQQPGQLSVPSVLGEPPACSNCGAWINCYSPCNGETGEWHCNFCMHLNSVASSSSSSASGGAGSGSGSSVTSSGFSMGSSSVAATAKAAAALGEAVDWVLPAAAGSTDGSSGLLALLVDVCAEQAELDVAKGALLRSLYGLHSSTHVALITFSSRTVAAYRLAQPHSQQQQQQQQQQQHPHAPASQAADAADLQGPLLVEADVLPGDAYMTDDILAALQRGVHAVPIRDCRQQLTAAIGALRSHSTSSSSLPNSMPTSSGSTAYEYGIGGTADSRRPRSLGGALEAALHIAVVLQEQPSVALQAQPPQQEMYKGRREGAGASGRAHVVVVTAGPASAYAVGVEAPGTRAQVDSSGDAEAEESAEAAASGALYFDEVAAVAAEHGVTIDVVAAAEAGRQLAPLAQATGGIFALHAPSANGSSSTSKAEASGTEASPESRSFAASIAAAVVRPAGLGCLLEVHTSSGLAVAEAYGAVLPLCIAGTPTDEWHEMTGGRQPAPRHWSNRRLSVYRTGVPNGGTGGVTLLLHCDKPPRQQQAFLQVCFRWTDLDGCAMTRVITRRLVTTKNPAAAVEALDPFVAGVVWAKGVAAQALQAGAAADRKAAEILRRQVGKQFSEFAAAYLLPDESSCGWFSGPSRFYLPLPFWPLAAALHQLVRGPLLHHAALPSADARELLQAHFMTASLLRSQQALLPQLHLLLGLSSSSSANSSGAGAGAGAGAGVAQDTSAAAGADASNSSSSGGSFIGPLPAADVLLLPAAAGVIDAGSKLFVWLGAGSSEQQQQQCLQLAQALAVDRMPAPDVSTVLAGSAEEAQRLYPRLLLLGDAHWDVKREVLPVLEALPKEAVRQAAEAARERLEELDTPSLLRWLRQLGMLPLPMQRPPSPE